MQQHFSSKQDPVPKHSARCGSVWGMSTLLSTLHIMLLCHSVICAGQRPERKISTAIRVNKDAVNDLFREAWEWIMRCSLWLTKKGPYRARAWSVWAVISIQCIFNTFYFLMRQHCPSFFTCQTERRISEVCSLRWNIHQMRSWMSNWWNDVNGSIIVTASVSLSKCHSCVRRELCMCVTANTDEGVEEETDWSQKKEDGDKTVTFSPCRWPFSALSCTSFS